MKAGTESRIKYMMLMEIMNLEDYQVHGILGKLWRFTAINAPDGELTRFSPEELAVGLGYRREPIEKLLEALSHPKCRWLDRDADGRLFVHDWEEHCEYTVHNQLARQGRRFAQSGNMPNMSRLTKEEREKCAPLFAAKPLPNGGEKPKRKKRTASVPKTLQERSESVSKQPTLPCPSMPLPKPPPSPSGATKPIEGSEGEGALGLVLGKNPEPTWDDAFAECELAGAKTAGWMCDLAKQRGHKPADLIAAARRVRSSAGAWEPGALGWWVKNAIPGRDPLDPSGWPTSKEVPLPRGPTGPTPEQRHQSILSGAVRLADAGKVQEALDLLVRSNIPEGDWPLRVTSKLEKA